MIIGLAFQPFALMADKLSSHDKLNINHPLEKDFSYNPSFFLE